MLQRLWVAAAEQRLNAAFTPGSDARRYRRGLEVSMLKYLAVLALVLGIAVSATHCGHCGHSHGRAGGGPEIPAV
jgi:hypothetical protein